MSCEDKLQELAEYMDSELDVIHAILERLRLEMAILRARWNQEVKDDGQST